MENFKLLIASLISPLFIALGLQLAAWIFWRKKRRLALGLLFSGGLALLTGSLPILSYANNRDREFVHPPLDIATRLTKSRPVLAVVLGTGFNPDPELPANSRVSGGFHARLLEGVRLYRQRDDVHLLISVAGKAPAETKRKFLNEMIDILNLDKKRVDIIDDGESTADEADATRKRIEEHGYATHQVVVVSSAGHMPRAMKIFADDGLAPVGAPADFHFDRKGNPNAKLWRQWIPSGGGMEGTRQMLYEATASIWHAIGGQ